ncbi:hypothetical protein E2C01_102569 [Portunus trituberculatus]|uniref:Uncharacterized protein n=1 Tax=Portunus trituberculatus TaxID=210409 RepID=A0A5B7KIN3_PORTR|nr:hypothetical protein [Portunus trituberculatus]
MYCALGGSRAAVGGQPGGARVRRASQGTPAATQRYHKAPGKVPRHSKARLTNIYERGLSKSAPASQSARQLGSYTAARSKKRRNI